MPDDDERDQSIGTTLPAPPIDETALALQERSVEIATGVFWVGKRDPQSVFHANPYLRIFRQERRGRETEFFNLLIDPGSASDFYDVRRKVEGELGRLQEVSAIYLNHQDPDVVSSSPILLRHHAQDASLICSASTWRLVRHLDLGRETFVDISKLAGGLRLPTGHALIPVPTPFCHFRGAVALYDLDSRVLFTGDLFGGLTEVGADGLWADESDWPGMRAFHQLYMPARAALRRAITLIEKLSPAPLIIAPQHGRLLKGKMIPFYMNLLSELPVGLDILEGTEAIGEPDGQLIAAWTEVLGRVMRSAQTICREDPWAMLRADPFLDEHLSVDASHELTILSKPKETVERVLQLFSEFMPARLAHLLLYEALSAAHDLDLPTPHFNIDGAEGMDLPGS